MLYYILESVKIVDIKCIATKKRQLYEGMEILTNCIVVIDSVMQVHTSALFQILCILDENLLVEKYHRYQTNGLSLESVGMFLKHCTKS